LYISGGLYYVMLFGNGGQRIFFSAYDRYHLYLLLQEGVARFGHRHPRFGNLKVPNWPFWLTRFSP
jgi:hypothetical protein